MQLQPMRVSGLIGAPCCGCRCLHTSVGALLYAVRFFGSQNQKRRGGAGRDGKDGRKKEKCLRTGGKSTRSSVWNVSSLFQLKGGGVEVSQNEWHRKLCHGQKEWAKQWDSHHQIKVH